MEVITQAFQDAVRAHYREERETRKRLLFMHLYGGACTSLRTIMSGRGPWPNYRRRWWQLWRKRMRYGGSTRANFGPGDWTHYGAYTATLSAVQAQRLAAGGTMPPGKYYVVGDHGIDAVIPGSPDKAPMPAYAAAAGELAQTDYADIERRALAHGVGSGVHAYQRCRHNMNPVTCDTCWALGTRD